eukprot:Nitzschia sp. Nitz4//scaffold335_size18684//1439//1759//NITZ4_008767-RA/size18684-processed-gene-0.14-mRNA-1//1//CDS//3329548267//4090//frame0
MTFDKSSNNTSLPQEVQQFSLLVPGKLSLVKWMSEMDPTSASSLERKERSQQQERHHQQHQQQRNLDGRRGNQISDDVENVAKEEILRIIDEVLHICVDDDTFLPF